MTQPPASGGIFPVLALAESPPKFAHHLERASSRRIVSGIITHDEIVIAPVRRSLDATIEVPGSKSITNRAMLLAALASGRSIIERALMSDDTRHMSEVLTTLGFNIETDESAQRIAVDGLGGRIPSSGTDLYVGGAGTAMRFIAGMLTLSRGRFRMDGNEQMRRRPVGPLLDALQRLGASIYSERENGCPPVIVDTTRGEFAGGETTIDARVSSQFVSALLMPAPLWPRGVTLHVHGDTARPFIDMTLKLMSVWGVAGRTEEHSIIVRGGQSYRAQKYVVEPDASSANYFAAAAALVGGRVRIKGIAPDSVQGDIGFLSLLARMGAAVVWRDGGVEVTGTGKLAGIDVEMTAMPDMVATLAALAPFALSMTRIRGVAFIRHHESDRIRAIATELKRLGA
ncbi:MAG: 3-phosphoshikimate 1-carboxyvinyltransferase, partial [Candidatus Binataceae bacterium]